MFFLLPFEQFFSMGGAYMANGRVLNSLKEHMHRNYYSDIFVQHSVGL